RARRGERIGETRSLLPRGSPGTRVPGFSLAPAFNFPTGGGLLTRGALPTPPSQPRGQWHVGAGASPLTAAGPFRSRTGFPDRSPVVGARLPSTRHGQVSRRPPLVARASLGRPDLRALVDPEPRHRARHLGLHPAQGRAHAGVRAA